MAARRREPPGAVAPKLFERGRITLEGRGKLLGKVRAGHDLEAAAAELNLPLVRIRADGRLMAEVGEAYRTATARLRSRLLDIALKGDDSRTLATLLAAREQAQARMGGEDGVPVDALSDAAAVEEWRRLIGEAATGAQEPAERPLVGTILRPAPKHDRPLAPPKVAQQSGVSIEGEAEAAPAPPPEAEPAAPERPVLVERDADPQTPLPSSRAPARAAGMAGPALERELAVASGRRPWLNDLELVR